MKKLRKRKIAKALNLRLKVGPVYMRHLKRDARFMRIEGEWVRELVFFSRSSGMDSRYFLDRLYAISAENVVRKKYGIWLNEEGSRYENI